MHFLKDPISATVIAFRFVSTLQITGFFEAGVLQAIGDIDKECPNCVRFLGYCAGALVAAVFGGGVSYAIANRNVYINSITAERSKWIEKLRCNLASYSATVAHTKLRSTGKQDDQIALVREKLEQQNDLAALIQLQLNPRGVIDQNILRIVETICIRSTTSVKLIQRADDLLIAHSQWLLKSEWEKVKYEARGPIYRFFHKGDEEKLIEEYKDWNSRQSSIDILITEFDGERAKPS